MAESTLEAPTIPEAAAAEQAVPREAEPWTLRAYVSEHPGIATAAVILVISVVLVVWARTRPSYDAYGWMVWGYQTLHGSLDLGGAPSWKPMPYLFTVLVVSLSSGERLQRRLGIPRALGLPYWREERT